MCAPGLGGQGLQRHRRSAGYGQFRHRHAPVGGCAGRHRISTSVLSGDDSLNSRPMGRIIRPLELMGARIEAREGLKAPLHIHGSGGLRGIDYASPVASAQIKSCLLLAGPVRRWRHTGAGAPAQPRPYRTHAAALWREHGRGSLHCAARSVLTALMSRCRPIRHQRRSWRSPPACCAGLGPAAAQSRGEPDPRRAVPGAADRMGADLEVLPLGLPGLEPLADIRVRYAGRLRGVDVPPECIPVDDR